MLRSVLAIVVLCAAMPQSAYSQSGRFESLGVQSPVIAGVASAILPGSGQALMRQKRSVLYLALETAGLAYYFSQHRIGNQNRSEYRRLSRSVARANFSPNGPVGNWDYYERMEKYVESGAFDAIGGGDIDPESNEETFNGAMWLLARQTFWRDPSAPPPAGSDEYRAAVNFYVSRAVKPEYRWSWSGDAEAFRKYRSAIASSNSAFRNAEQTLSLVLANHFLSAVDAYTSLKVRVRRAGNGTATIVASHTF